MKRLTRYTINQVLLAKVSLYSEDYEDRNTVIAPGRANSRQTQNVLESLPYDNLVGQRIVPCTRFRDEVENTEKRLFIFQNLSIRVTGRYRLRCDIYSMGNPFLILDSVYTNVFDVYTPRDYPGQIPITVLERSLLRHGIKLHSKHSNKVNAV
jgi:hypothetical protein